jgi:hypothetical protein
MVMVGLLLIFKFNSNDIWIPTLTPLASKEVGSLNGSKIGKAVLTKIRI